MIKDNLSKVQQRISTVCFKVNRSPDSITIVAVSKGRRAEEIRQAVEAGIIHIGENKIQEAVLKYKEVSDITWHMVGHLQTNKCKEAVKIFDLIHSVDSLHLAAEIDKQAARINKIQDILLEIKTSPEDSKFGIKPEDTVEVIKEMVKLKNINTKGLMTIAPMVGTPDKARPYFKILKELKDKINESHIMNDKLQILSMGMTDDFEVAIEEGSTMIRLGRAIFSRQ